VFQRKWWYMGTRGHKMTYLWFGSSPSTLSKGAFPHMLGVKVQQTDCTCGRPSLVVLTPTVRMWVCGAPTIRMGVTSCGGDE
jgi:hypothetical protein